MRTQTTLLVLLNSCCYAAVAAATAAADDGPPSTVWTTLTEEPGSSEFYGHATAQGAMPIGNGDTTALVWPDFEVGAVHVQVAKQDAMGNDMALLKLGTVTLVAGLPLRPAHFKQTLDLANATVMIEAGATAASATVVTVWVDASSNCVRARVSATSAASRSSGSSSAAAGSSPLVVELSSVRSTGAGIAAWDTGGGLNNCTYCTGTTYWQPADVFDDPPGSPATVSQIHYYWFKSAISQPASYELLTRYCALARRWMHDEWCCWQAPLVLSHSNPRNFSIVKAVLTQQGLGAETPFLFRFNGRLPRQARDKHKETPETGIFHRRSPATAFHPSTGAVDGSHIRPRCQRGRA
jgi:hypothetical protein